MSTANRIATFVPIELNRRRGRKITVARHSHPASMSTHESTSESMIFALARAFYWQRLLDGGHVRSGAEIAERGGLHVSTVNEMLRLTLLDSHVVDLMLTAGADAAPNTYIRLINLTTLAPDIVAAILDGTLPPNITFFGLSSGAPMLRDKQRAKLAND